MATVRPRRDGDRPEVWALPKGLIDRGERGAETAVREVLEETGLRAVVERKLGDVRYVYTWKGEQVFKVVSFFLVRYSSGRLGDLTDEFRHEVADTKWLPLEEAPRLLTYKGEREMAAKALQLIEERGL